MNFQDARWSDAGADDICERDELKEKCGVFGIWGHPEAGMLAALGLHALQHRGQEGCGVVTFDGHLYHHERHMGLVKETVGSPQAQEKLKGHAALGHTRYATQGATILRNIQPLFADIRGGGFAIAHNGNLTNARELRERLVNEGAIFQSTSDTEAVLQILARSQKTRVIDRFVEALTAIEGGYALVCLTDSMLIGARDPVGIRPLVLGHMPESAGHAWVLASETCALDMIGATFVRDVRPGEIIMINGEGVTSIEHPMAGKVRVRPCVFEYVYFSRPDSVVNGLSVYEVRKRMGRRLAMENIIDADIVVPIPDSGVPAALGFAEGSGLPLDFGIIRGHYAGRTFIQPKQEIRQLGVKMKHAPNRSVLKGKRVILIDDSIVRGTTSAKIVELVREAGAREIHFLSASPQIKFPDFYGIDMPSKSQLFAANHSSLKEMATVLKADSVSFLTIEGMYWALGEERRDPENPKFADHCFTGDYPTRLVDAGAARADKDHQISFLGD